ADEGHLADRSLILNHQLGRVHFVFSSESIALFASTISGIERERPRFELGNRDAAIDAGHSFGIKPLFAINDRDDHHAVRKSGRRANGFFQTRPDSIFYQQPVDDDFNRMIAAFVERDLFVHRPHLTIDPGTSETAFLNLFELFLEFTLSPTNDRRKDHYTFAFGQLADALDDLFS